MSKGGGFSVCRLCGAKIPDEMLTRERQFEHLICWHFDFVMSLAESLWECEDQAMKKVEMIKAIVG
jgi:hypothetical protein